MSYEYKIVTLGHRAGEVESLKDRVDRVSVYRIQKMVYIL
jgi:hypothetical protein